MLISINNHQINYAFLNEQIIDETKPIVVFLHEGLGSIRQWKDFPQKLCDSLSLKGLIYDRYGYGLSDTMNEPRKMTFLHEEAWLYLPTLLEKLKISNRIILVGHSDGASIALIYAARFSDKLVCVISEAAHVLLEEISLQGIQQIKDDYYKSESLRKMFQIYHPDKADIMFNGWVNTWLSPDFKDWNIENLLRDISVPVLAIQGDQDEYGSYEQLNSIKKNVRAAVEILFIPDCGHTPHLQSQELVLDNMNRFISAQIK